MSKEKKFHFNFIDILIVLCFVILIAGFAFYATGNWQTNTDTSETSSSNIVRYVLNLENIQPELAFAIEEGDTVKDSAKETVKGQIAEIIKREKTVSGVFSSNEGVYVQSEHPENYTVELAVESSYVLNNNTVMIDDTEIKVGNYVHYKTDKYAFGAYIIGVEIIEK